MASAACEYMTQINDSSRIKGGTVRNLILSASVMGLGMHLGAWMARDGAADDYVQAQMYAEVARCAEAAKLHALFFADALTNAEEGTDRPSLGALDPTIVLTAMAAVTQRIGLVGTVSTTYAEPYEVARRIATLDHLSGGRAGWNSVATFIPAVAAMFNDRGLPDRSERYGRADEFLRVCFKLWDSWSADAVVGDKDNAVFAAPDKVHPIDHVGEHFQVKGPLPLPRSPQGRPVIFQAGSSEEGRAQAALYADVVFTAQHLLADGLEFRGDIRSRAEQYGRDPDHIKVLPGISLILGETDADARERKAQLDRTLGADPELAKLARRVGLSPEVLVLDEPFPEHLLCPDDEFKGSVGFRRSLVNLARSESMTVRQLIDHYGGGHQQVVGSANSVADVMEEWFRAGAADGFNLMVDIVPSGFHLIERLLVPELQKRGLFHLDYAHTTFRQNLGLPAEPASAPHLLAEVAS
uniref:Possible mono-oxygenase n=1 Tax=Mycolicibacterium brisbanense TaxID=146020 RepID=B8R4J8_9MYCO|nr:possible mono-oxygenase [Mycolicibacterium brisbanense]